MSRQSNNARYPRPQARSDNRPQFEAVFDGLRKIMARHGPDLVCVNDEAGDYHLDTAHIMKNRKPLFFGAVRTGKNYVSYHLMPVYVFPELLEDVSQQLRRRMQGKSCFNFRAVDESLFRELAELTVTGFNSYKATGYV